MTHEFLGLFFFEIFVGFETFINDLFQCKCENCSCTDCKASCQSACQPEEKCCEK